MEVDVLKTIATVILMTIALAAAFVSVSVYLYLRKEEREVNQWLKDLDEQHQRLATEITEGGEQDDYADIDPEADTVEFTPLPPDVTPPNPREKTI